MITQEELDRRLYEFALQQGMIKMCEAYEQAGYPLWSIQGIVKALLIRVRREMLNADPVFRAFDQLNRKELICLREIFTQCSPQASPEDLIELARTTVQQAAHNTTDQIRIEISAIPLEAESAERRQYREELIKTLGECIAAAK